jgi:hypothetical protein
MDHVIRGVPGDEATFYLLEEKTHSDKNFQKIKKEGLVNAYQKHYVQAQTYMRLSGLTHCIYWAVNKNTDDIHVELIHLAPLVANGYLEKAHHIITSDNGVQGISRKRSFFKCKWCSYHANCFDGKPPAKNCRTCVHATPDLDGTDGRWLCKMGCPELMRDPTGNGSCEYWLPNPATMPGRDITYHPAGEPEDCLLIERKPDGKEHTYTPSLEPEDFNP